MNYFEKYADLDLPLVPGERVVYITEGANLVRRPLVIATNKRLLLAKRGLFTSYTSLFYNTISLVHFKGGLFMPAVMLKLNGTEKLKFIRTRSMISAKSLFSILSNRVIIDHDVAMTYKAVDEMTGLDNDASRKAGEHSVGVLSANIVEVVERLEEANGAFAEMVRMIEGNVMHNAEAKKAANRELNTERIERLQMLVRGVSISALNATAAAMGAHRKRKPFDGSWIDFVSAAKRLEKISISDSYDSALFVPQGSTIVPDIGANSGLISARIEGMPYNNSSESMNDAVMHGMPEAELAAATDNAEVKESAASAISAVAAQEVQDVHQVGLVGDMLMFKIRNTKEKLSGMH